MCDQLNPYVLSPYRENMAITPTYQQLADEGIVFKNAYCNNPLCVPSRMSMMIGQYAVQNEIYDNGSVLNSETPCFTHHLISAGYQTVLSGKMHFIGADQSHGFQERLTTDIYPAEISWIPNWQVDDKPIPFKKKGHRSQEAISNLRRSFFVNDKPEWNKFQQYDELATFKALEWLRKRKLRSCETPFFLCVSLTNPHNPYVANKKLFDLYKDREIPMPDVPYLAYEKLDNLNDKWLQDGSQYFDDRHTDDVRKARKNYFAQSTFTDQKLKQLIDGLKETGEYEDTWIIVTSDHSDMIGERGLFTKKHFCEQSIRVPLIIKPPTAVEHKKIETNVSLIDIFPTLLDMAGISDSSHDGESLLSISQENKARNREVISEITSEGIRAPILIIIDNNHKYVNIYNPYTKQDEELLFDMKSDSAELINLSQDKSGKNQNIIGTMRRKALKHNWNGEKLYKQICQSQKERKFVRNAMAQSGGSWSFQPEVSDIDDELIYRRVSW
ncbi:MAG: sulfatase-like hydrolase/transferase [Victivallaceae bacterium]|nr:sulfatase-like hydrolase/transferase [Victivallaceae bacterium]